MVQVSGSQTISRLWRTRRPAESNRPWVARRSKIVMNGASSAFSRLRRDESNEPRSTARAASDDTMTRESREFEFDSDEFLFKAYRNGNRQAFRRLMERYRQELLHFLIRFLGGRAAAEDVFQEAFLQIHISADKFDPTRRFKPWLFTIASNKARDYLRKHSKRSGVSLSASVGDDEDNESFVDLLEAELPDPDAPVLDAERSRVVKEIIDAMPAHLREILLLAYFQRLSYNQIADSLDIPLGTVKSRLHAAVASFAQAWKAAQVRGEQQQE